MSKGALALIIPLSILATFMLTFRIARPAPVYGWKEVSRAPVPLIASTWDCVANCPPSR